MDEEISYFFKFFSEKFIHAVHAEFPAHLAGSFFKLAAVRSAVQFQLLQRFSSGGTWLWKPVEPDSTCSSVTVWFTSRAKALIFSLLIFAVPFSVCEALDRPKSIQWGKHHILVAGAGMDAGDLAAGGWV